jgi:hypothetical protein
MTRDIWPNYVRGLNDLTGLDHCNQTSPTQQAPINTYFLEQIHQE